jgi:protein-disulfide isomerase
LVPVVFLTRIRHARGFGDLRRECAVLNRWVRFFSFAAFALVLAAADDRQSQEARVLATVNGESITSAQLEAAVRKQMEALEERAQQLRQAALNKLIDNLLLEQAARAERVSVGDYLSRHVESVGVSAAEVDQAYERSRDQFAGVLPAEAKYRIRRTIEDNRRGAALNALLETLRRQARVTNHAAEERLAALDFAAQESPSQGGEDARVTVVEFSDFACRYCRAAQPALRRILERWPGRVRLVFRHFPLEQHPDALPAARAAACAERQGRFWELHDRIFALTGPLSEAALRSAASAAGVNASDYEACMSDEESLERVRKDVLLGRLVGVTGTPAFFVNREPVTGAAELETKVERIMGGLQ